METEIVFRIMLVILIVGFMAHRAYYTRTRTASDEKTVKQGEDGMASRFAGILGMVGFFGMIAYAIDPGWVKWASLPLPLWFRWAGLGIAIAGFGLLQWAQNTLGKNWSDTPRMMEDQQLVRSGPYRWIRHPIYSAFILILGSTLIISSNWLIGLSWVGMTMLEVISRVRFEESLMIEYFGDQYQNYMKTTGAFLPRLKS